MTKELVTNSHFTRGFSGFSSDYAPVDGRASSARGTSPSYDVDRRPSHAANAYPDWATFGDHTTGHGKMLIVDGGPGDAWREQISLAAGTTYTFSVWAHHALDGTNGYGGLPVLQFFADGVEIGTSLTVEGAASGWQQLTFTFTAATAISEISLRDLNTSPAYNDFCLDDISIRRVAANSVGPSSNVLPPEHQLEPGNIFAESHHQPAAAWYPVAHLDSPPNVCIA